MRQGPATQHHKTTRQKKTHTHTHTKTEYNLNPPQNKPQDTLPGYLLCKCR